MSDDTKTRASKRTSVLDHVNQTVTIDGILYPAGGFAESVRTGLVLKALAHTLMTAPDPAAAYEALKAGKAPGRTAAAPKPGNPWHEAAATVHAEATIKAAGVKRLPGNKHREAPEYRAAYENALTAAKGWDLEKLRQAKSHPDVVAEHGRITGKSADLGSLFAPSAPVAEEQPAPLAEAA